MEFGPPKINEVFDMQGKKKYFHPQEKKHVAFRMLHSVHIFDLSFFCNIILSFLRHFCVYQIFILFIVKLFIGFNATSSKKSHLNLYTKCISNISQEFTFFVFTYFLSLFFFISFLISLII